MSGGLVIADAECEGRIAQGSSEVSLGSVTTVRKRFVYSHGTCPLSGA